MVMCPGVFQVLLRFLGVDEASLGEINASKLAWMVDTPIMDKMLEQVRQSPSFASAPDYASPSTLLFPQPGVCFCPCHNTARKRNPTEINPLFKFAWVSLE